MTQINADKQLKTFILCSLVLLLFGCSERDTETTVKGKPVVYSVNYPLAYFAERIAGDQINVVFPEMDGDPAFWEPAPEQVIEFQNADLILLNGAAYAKWIPKVSLPQSKLVNTSALFSDQYIALDGIANHKHGPGGEHAHGDLAFTTWLDASLALEQASSIHMALAKHFAMTSSNFDALEADLISLNTEMKTAFTRFGNQPLLGSHPVYQYLSRAYNLDLQSVHWEPDAEPTEKMWRELDDLLEVHDAKIMLWEGEPLPSVKARLLEKGIQSIVFDPCGNHPESGDYLTVMKQNIANLSSATLD